jgi:hypothetical protein
MGNSSGGQAGEALNCACLQGPSLNMPNMHVHPPDFTMSRLDHLLVARQRVVM